VPPAKTLKSVVAYKIVVITSVSAVQVPPSGPALLAEITANLAAGEDLRQLLDRFLDPLLTLSNARAGTVRMLSEHGDQLEMISSRGLPDSVQQAERRVARECGFCGGGVSEVRIAHASELRDCAMRTGEQFFAQECRSAVAVPLQHKGRVLGVYDLFFSHGEAPAPPVLALLRSVGELLGLALEKHRLEAENLRATISRERQMMAAELHDAVAQNLTFIKMRLPLLRDAIEADQKEAALAYLEDVRETLGEAHGSLREIVTHFRTRVDPRGLARALELLAAQFRTRAGIALHLESPLPELALGDQARADLFHIVQEALANVERHSRARNAWMSLEPGLGRVELRIEDDGVGPVAGRIIEPAHWGLEIMRERAHRLGGELSVTPREGGGTVVRCAFPLPRAETP
jgi:two-component system, NarL family, nitrate/nitrite sensor histidine kinase NarX